LSYFPSCLLLGVLTDVGHDVYHRDGIADVWGWMLPVILVIYVVIAWILARVVRFWLNRELSGGFVVNTNLLILLLLCFMTVGIGNDNIHFHHELQVEVALRKQDYERALEVAGKTMDPSRNLTALRAYTMSRRGTMGDELFRYPQLYGAAGLLIGTSNDKTLRLNADSLSVYLGAKPALGETALDFFRRICHKEMGNYTTLDYYLSALLLEKRLDEFVKEYNALYTVRDSIPLYYSQALYLHARMHGNSMEEITNEDLESLWERYRAKQVEFSGQKGEANRMRREFGDTYWWYYQYK